MLATMILPNTTRNTTVKANIYTGEFDCDISNDIGTLFCTAGHINYAYNTIADVYFRAGLNLRD